MENKVQSNIATVLPALCSYYGVPVQRDAREIYEGLGMTILDNAEKLEHCLTVQLPPLWSLEKRGNWTYVRDSRKHIRISFLTKHRSMEVIPYALVYQEV